MNFDPNKFSAADEANLTKGEKEAIVYLRKKVLNGEMSVVDANEQAEAFRAGHGYHGGADGSDFKLLDFSADREGTALRRLQNFNMGKYRKSNDYKNLLDQYTAAGKTAMKDTLGEASARTGGMASSYAVAAGQDGYNRYMQGLEAAAQQDYATQRAQLQADADAEERMATLRAQQKMNNELATKSTAVQQILNYFGAGGKWQDLTEDKRKEWLKNSGLSEAEINTYQNHYGNLLAQKAVVPAVAPKLMDLKNAEKMAKAGQFTDEVLAAFREKGMNDAYLVKEYGYNPIGVETLLGKVYMQKWLDGEYNDEQLMDAIRAAINGAPAKDFSYDDGMRLLQYAGLAE